MYELLVNFPTEDDGWDDEICYEIIVRFLAEYATNVNGKRTIRQ